MEAFRYNRRAFVMPPWGEIYETDRERKQDFAEAVRTYEALAATYAECGYELVEVPRTTVEDRMRFVLDAAGILAGTMTRDLLAQADRLQACRVTHVAMEP